MQKRLKEIIENILVEMGVNVPSYNIEHPKDLENGDYSTNVALIIAKESGKNPQEIATEIVNILEKKVGDNQLEEIKSVSVAGPGFINFFLDSNFFNKSLLEIINTDDAFGRGNILSGQKIIIEYTDPNPFKIFHIGHLMANTIGESISRIVEWNGAEVKRANYQGDIGLHVAQAVWGMVQNRAAFPEDNDDLKDKVSFLANAYSFGNLEYRKDENAKKEIEAINKKLYEMSDPELKIYYDKGRKWSLEAFDEMYFRLGTKFDYFFFESQVGLIGKQLVLDNIANGVFEESDGAVVYKGEKFGLHTRVFINSLGIPTYEAKELALAKKKFSEFPYDRSIVVTGNEIDQYFKVLISALSQIEPDLAQKTRHISHGMLRLPEGKMSSRTGNVVTAESLIEETKQNIFEKMSDRDYDSQTKEAIAEVVAVGALKYSILKQAPGKDIIFDFDKSLSFDGDSGPYLQYTYTRAMSILKKAEEAGIPLAKLKSLENWQTREIERLLYRLPEVIEIAYTDLSPQNVVTYLISISSSFNSFYANEQIIDKDNPESSHKILITQAVAIILRNGLDVLGIKVPPKM